VEGTHPDSISENENKPYEVHVGWYVQTIHVRVEMSLTTVDHRPEEAGAVVKYRLSEVLPCSGNGVELTSGVSVVVVAHTPQNDRPGEKNVLGRTSGVNVSNSGPRSAPYLCCCPSSLQESRASRITCAKVSVQAMMPK